MGNKNISDRDLKLLEILLGEDLVEEFKIFLQNRNNRNSRRNSKKGRNSYRKLKKYVVDVSNFRERDLVGYWDYDDCYFDDKLYFEPSWLRGLVIECRENPYNTYEVVFTGADKASEIVYNRLKKLKETGILTEDFSLPSNASYGEVKLPNKVFVKPKSNRHDNEDKESGASIFFDYNEYDVLR